MSYLVTDIDAVTEAVKAKAPRSIKELAVELHGENVTVSKSGTVHAKHDGYTCPYTSTVYRAGEFVPLAEPEVVNNRRSKKRYKVVAKLDESAWVAWQNLTSGQAKAARAQLRQQTARVRAKTSKHVGEVKTRLKGLELVVDYVFAPRYDGGCRICGLIDGTGNVFIYFGDTSLGGPGDTVTIDATIKAHTVRDGVKQTIINRPKVSNCTEADDVYMPTIFAYGGDIKKAYDIKELEQDYDWWTTFDAAGDALLNHRSVKHALLGKRKAIRNNVEQIWQALDLPGSPTLESTNRWIKRLAAYTERLDADNREGFADVIVGILQKKRETLRILTKIQEGIGALDTERENNEH